MNEAVQIFIVILKQFLILCCSNFPQNSKRTFHSEIHVFRPKEEQQLNQYYPKSQKSVHTEINFRYEAAYEMKTANQRQHLFTTDAHIKHHLPFKYLRWLQMSCANLLNRQKHFCSVQLSNHQRLLSNCLSLQILCKLGR